MAHNYKSKNGKRYSTDHGLSKKAKRKNGVKLRFSTLK